MQAENVQEKEPKDASRKQCWRYIQGQTRWFKSFGGQKFNWVHDFHLMDSRHHASHHNRLQ